MRWTVLLALAAFAAGYFLRGEWAPRAESTHTRSEQRDTPAATPTERKVQPPVTPAGGTVRGRVTADDKPLAGVLVVATHRERYVRGDGLGAPESGPRHEVRTGADGAYELTGLDDAVHKIWPYSEGYRFRSKSDAHVRPGARVDFAGERVVRVEIDIWLPDGTHPEFASVYLKGGARERDSGLHTCYRDSPWIWVVPGRYEVRVRTNGGYVAKPRGLQAEDGARWVFRLTGSSRIHGDIRLPAGFDYVKAITVYALPFKGEPPKIEEIFDASLRTERGGHMRSLRYHIRAKPGHYLVGVAFGDRHDKKKGEILASAIVEVADGPVEQDFDIPSFESKDLVAVRVTAGGKPVPEIKFEVGIELKNAGGSSTAWWIRRTDETYLVRPHKRRNVKGGRDYVSGFARGYGVFPRTYFRRGLDRELSIELRGPAFVHVHVLGYERGRYKVMVRRKSGQHWFDSSNNGRLSQDGDIDLGPIQPGAHWLTLTRENVGLVVAETVELAEGENRFEIKMPKLYKVTILVPDRVFTVQLALANAPQLHSRFARPEKGNAVFENIPAGAYVVNFQGEHGAGKSVFDVSGPTEVNVR